MAVYTTLFSATLVELQARFPNVAEPLSIPRVVQRVNPFTKQPISVETFEPEFGEPRHRRSLFADDGLPAMTPVFVQSDDYGQYLASLVPHRLRSLPHVGTKDVAFLEAEELLELGENRAEMYVNCLPDEGSVEVASTRLVDTLRENQPEELRERFPEAWQAFPLEWLQALVLAPAPVRRYLCAWVRL